MSSQGEKIGSALAKAIKGTAAKMKEEAPAAKMYRTNMRDVPKVEGLKREDGWVDMQVQFLIDKKSAGVDNVVGWTLLKPGASHENHRHHNCDEFFIVLKGKGHIYHRARSRALGRRRRGLFAARLLARLQQHIQRRRGAGLGLDGRRLDRGFRLPGASGEVIRSKSTEASRFTAPPHARFTLPLAGRVDRRSVATAVGVGATQDQLRLIPPPRSLRSRPSPQGGG